MSYDEDTLIEQPAIKLFESMGWQSCNCYDEVLGVENGTIGREDRSDVVLVRRLRDAITRLNPELDTLLIEAEIGRVDDIDNAVESTLCQLVSGDLLLRRVGAERIGTREVDQ
jgi:type I site-specific restriction-modification system R (restriction) subunit